MFKDRPTEWHTLPTTKKGVMMIPLTKEACDRNVPHSEPAGMLSDGSSRHVPPPPEPTGMLSEGFQEVKPRKAKKMEKKPLSAAWKK